MKKTTHVATQNNNKSSTQQIINEPEAHTLTLIKAHPVCGGHYTAYELCDGLTYFMTQEGISIHRSFDDVLDCLDDKDRASFVGKLNMTYNAIEVANHILSCIDLEEWMVKELKENIEIWEKERPRRRSNSKITECMGIGGATHDMILEIAKFHNDLDYESLSSLKNKKKNRNPFGGYIKRKFR